MVKDHKGIEYLNVRQMALAYKADPILVANRLRAGWSVEEALTKPIRERAKNRTKAKAGVKSLRHLVERALETGEAQTATINAAQHLNVKVSIWFSSKHELYVSARGPVEFDKKLYDDYLGRPASLVIHDVRLALTNNATRPPIANLLSHIHDLVEDGTDRTVICQRIDAIRQATEQNQDLNQLVAKLPRAYRD